MTTEQTPTPTPEPTEPSKVEPSKDEQTGHMVYDLTLKRFVGRIGDSKSAAEKTVSKVKGHRYETRKV